MSSDEATRHTLRQLKESGAFNQPVLDDSIARDLLRTPPPQTQRPTTNPNSSVSSIGIQRQQTSGVTQQNTSATTTTANAPQQQQQPGGGGSGGGNEQSTVDLVNKLNSDCDSFSKALADTTRGSKEAIHRSALHLFLTTVRTKLPLCILHSLPKFNRAATAANGVTASNTATTTTHNNSMANSTSRLPPLRDQHHHSNSILNDIPTGAAIAKALTSHSVEKSQPNVPFDITLQDNVVEGISADILSAVEAEMRKCQSALAVELQRVLQDVAALKQRLEILEEANMQVLNDSKMQSDRLGEALDRVKELEGTSKELNMQLTDKETQMDLFREQVKRRNTTIDELRANFRREVIRYKTKIYELQQELDATVAGKGQMGGPKGGGGGGQRHSVDEGDLGGEGGSGMGGGGGGGPGSPAQGMGGGDTVEKLRDQIRSMKVEFSKEKKALQQELKAKLDGKENELYHLRSRVRALEMELEKVKAGAPSTTA